MLQPWGKGLLATTLRYPYEVRDAESYFDDIGEIHIPKDMLALAEHILDSKAADFDASKFHDRYEAAVVAIINEKKAGLPVSVQRQIPRSSPNRLTFTSAPLSVCGATDPRTLSAACFRRGGRASGRARSRMASVPTSCPFWRGAR